MSRLMQVMAKIREIVKASGRSGDYPKFCKTPEGWNFITLGTRSSRVLRGWKHCTPGYSPWQRSDGRCSQAAFFAFNSVHSRGVSSDEQNACVVVRALLKSGFTALNA